MAIRDVNIFGFIFSLRSLVVFLFILCVRGSDIERNLLGYLFRNYNRDVRPVANVTQPIEVRVAITPCMLVDMNVIDQVLTMDVWFTMEWKDAFLKWDPEKYDNQRSLVIPARKIWQPDIALHNNAAENKRHLTKREYDDTCIVSKDGTVFCVWPTRLKSRCPMSSSSEESSRICHMTFASWVHSSFQIHLVLRSAEVDQTQYVPNRIWKIENINATRSEIYYPCCPEPFLDVTYTFIFRKIDDGKGMPITIAVLLLLVPFQFILPPESNQRITLGGFLMTIHVAFYSKDAKWGEWSLWSLCLVILSILLSILTSHMCLRQQERGRVSSCIRKACLSGLGKLLGVCDNSLTHVIHHNSSYMLGGTPGDTNYSLVNLLRGVIEEKYEREKDSQEWYRLAMVSDRLCFSSFLILSTLTVVFNIKL
ncbi:hypothetical protein CHS0354_013167 [Potamilus streckersoni]|uniref:Neurotransmitter-gated ion-channel ligand-binding domain-containing protein n=1 Tax=Potamilus streckersoni TaxID=2493646 RepID=A0AAE0T816_9BIVA|nr:hypothetical protein CHS0354_013167 [Potamilus streckersoni]